MRLVADDEVVTTFRSAELLLHVLVARQLVEARDGEVVLEEPVAGAGGLELVVRHDLEGEVEAAAEFVLPLLRQASGTDDQTAMQIAAGDQLLHQETRHDRLAGAGIVRQQKAQRLARQHGFVDRRDLVRERINDRGMHGQHRIEQVGEADALRF